VAQRKSKWSLVPEVAISWLGEQLTQLQLLDSTALKEADRKKQERSHNWLRV